jgi:hypothetical protein
MSQYITIRAITLHEPYASLIAIGAKRIETRHWPLKTVDKHGDFIDEPFVIHAAKTTATLKVIEQEPLIAKALSRAGLIDFDFQKKKLRGITAVANRIRCYPQEELDPALLTPLEHACGYYAPKRFGWVMEDIYAPSERIPHPGRQGQFSVDADLFRGRAGHLVNGTDRVPCEDIYERLFPSINASGHWAQADSKPSTSHAHVALLSPQLSLF